MVLYWYGIVWSGIVWYGLVWSGMVWYGMAWYGMVWYGMVCMQCMCVFMFFGFDCVALHLLSSVAVRPSAPGCIWLGISFLQFLGVVWHL